MQHLRDFWDGLHPERQLERQREALTNVWGDSDLATKVGKVTANGSDQFTAEVRESWGSDETAEGDTKPPILIRTLAIQVGDNAEETMTISLRVDSGSNPEYKLESEGAASMASVTSTQPVLVHSTFDGWVINVGNANVINMTNLLVQEASKEVVPTQRPHTEPK